jgi:DNA gyrase subunit A
VRGASLRADDIVEHLFVTTTHHWLLFFTNLGRVYRVKAYELPDTGRDARGQHLANVLALQPDETVAQVMDLRDYEVAPYLVLATRGGKVKKTRLAEYDSNRSGGIIAINLIEGDELISARLASETDDLILVSKHAQSARFTADDATLRPMGRATSGVTGMRFRPGDELLAMDVVREGADLLTVTDGGYAKRTSLGEWAAKGRGILGMRAMRLVDERGGLVGAVVVDADDEVFAITSGGGVIRTPTAEVRQSGRDTMGVRLINLKVGDAVVAAARNAESGTAESDGDSDGDDQVGVEVEVDGAVEVEGDGAAEASVEPPADGSGADAGVEQ